MISRQSDTPEKAIIAAGHPEVCRAAGGILQSGGNAFDAVVAAGFASSVAEPALTSLGGGGFLLARTREGEEIVFDFFVDTPGLGLEAERLDPHFFPVTVHFPGSDQDFNVGLGSVAVPGNLKGFLHVHRRFGQLPLEAVLEPAIHLADGGVELNESQAYLLRLLEPIMGLSSTGRVLYQAGDDVAAAGSTIVNPELAVFLRDLATGRSDDFYRGDLAAEVAEDMRKGQGLLTRKDLAAYQVKERRPQAFGYRNHTLLTNPPPSMGGSLIGLALSLLDGHDSTGIRWGSPEYAMRQAGLMIEVERLRDEGITPAALDAAGRRLRGFSRGTTHISIADRQGNVAAMTTSNGEGSGYFVPGTGIMLNNMMGEDDLHPDGFHASPPARRVASMMSPSMLLADGRVRLVIGSGGSKRIRTAITQVISNILDFDLTVQEAVDAPRLHWDGTVLQVEPGFPAETMTALTKNWPANLWTGRDVYFGGVHAVIPGEAGGGDPRRGGSVLTIT